MNKKRKFNELYKGVFKNDKKSCLIDLKPLDKKREIEKELHNKKEIEEGKNLNNFSKEDRNPNVLIKNKNRLGINLRVAKNLGFGSFFRKVREEIVDIFLSKEEFISFEGLINSNSINDLFNFPHSTSKNFIDKEIINLENTSKKDHIARNPQSYVNIANKTTEIIKREETGMSIINDDEEILYEDECETIYKKRKIPQNVSNRKFHFYYDNFNHKNEMDPEGATEVVDIFNLSNLNSYSDLRNMNKQTNSSNLINNLSIISERNNIGNMSNFSRLSSNNILTNNFNQFIPNNNKNSQILMNKNIIDIDEDMNFALYKMKQNNKKNLSSTNILLSDENSFIGNNEGYLAMKAIKNAAIRGPLSNISNKLQD